ncbi:phospholipase D-like domain-containing protein [Rhodanobacter sp. L36]|uniref:phospholipase D-like domain-containing protein n=1 Tax=Rhodanobacter sp. L36 TaxID=1747221 RepID=UPI00131B9E1B|nr:phospholipase D-like domain-containing protein [Rhodanobacter sp. L36]
MIKLPMLSCLWALLFALPIMAETRHRVAPAADFQIVESVPEATVYGAPGVPRTQDVWLQMIRGARHSIDIAAFYISDRPGSSLTPVLDALIARANAGVHVRVLLDQSFLKNNQVGVDRLRQNGKITIRLLPITALTGGVLHAKYLVVDSADVFVGSANLDWRALEQIHEIGVRVLDARFAQTFEATFDVDWQLADQTDLPKAAERAAQAPGFAPVTAADPIILNARSDDPLIVFPAFSPPALMPAWVTQEQAALVQMIEASRHVLRIQAMTISAIKQFGPKGWWPPIDNALRDAAARGVDVRIIVADWSLREPTQAYLKSLAVLPNITIKFSQLPPAPEGFIAYARVEHAKYVVADDRSAFIGTGNWEWSYFNTSVDASVFVHGVGAAKTLTQIFDAGWNGRYVTTLDPGKNYAAPRTH